MFEDTRFNDGVSNAHSEINKGATIEEKIAIARSIITDAEIATQSNSIFDVNPWHNGRIAGANYFINKNS